MKKNAFVMGAFILTMSGILSRIMGFFYRIFLSRTIGEEGMGIYQLSFSVTMLCLSLCAMGFQTSISRFTAGSSGSKRSRYLLVGTCLSLTISIPISIFVYLFSPEIACYFLMESKCESLVRLIALSIPFSAIHNCLCGYYFGCKKASIPAFSQLVEKGIQVASVWILWQVLSSKGEPITAFHAMVGTVISEIGNVLFLAFVWFLTPSSQTKHETPSNIPSHFTCTKQILYMTIPLIANRVSMSFLHSIESAMIPKQLCQWGMEQTEAIGIFGVLTGMVMPFLLFPSALSSSAALMLLPSIASEQSQKNTQHITTISNLNIQFCLWLGIFSCGVFLFYGSDIGMIVFHSALAGHFLETLSWLCPFLYLIPTMGSILNGLGKTNTVFWHNLLGLLIQLLAVFVWIPKIGIQGYLLGLLIGQLLTCFFHFFTLQKHIGIHFPFWNYIGLPTVSTLITGWIGKGSFYFLVTHTNLPAMLCIFFAITIMGLLFLYPAYSIFLPRKKSTTVT